MSTFLEIWGTGDDTLADRTRAVARGTVLVDVVKGLQDQAREALKQAVEQESERTGTAFTARLDGVTALLTDPQPKPKLIDRDAFAGWFAEAYPDDVEEVERVEVIDGHRAVRLTADIEVGAPDGQEDWENAARALASCVKVYTEVLLPEKAIDLAYDRGRLHVTDDHVIDVDTGEPVAGLAASRGKPVMQVKLDKQARMVAGRQVREAMGIPAEVETGGRS